MTTIPSTIVLAHYHGKQKVEQLTVAIEDAHRRCNELNEIAAREWNWRLDEINFIDDDGCGMSVDDSEDIRRAVYALRR